MQHNQLLLLTTVTLTSLVGCAYKPKALPIRQIQEYPNVVVQQDTSLAAEQWNRTTSSHVLGQPVNSKGFVPLLVVVKNNGSNRAIIDGDRIVLEDGQGQLHERVDTEIVLKKCEKSVALHFAFFGALAGLSAGDYNKKMAEDWRDKEFPSQVVLEPYMSTAGLLFYRIEDEASVSGSRLLVPLAAWGKDDYEEVSCVLP